jgi:ATP-dependent Clp protease ATP-binding subunit ClpC
MIGSPPGYIGFEEGGQLTEAVRRRPYCVILFDEIEKAHPEVFNIFLQILDNGRLTDSKGRVVNFKNTIIIMTSNIGNEVIQEYSSLGFVDKSSSDKETDEEKFESRIKEELRRHFKPEFINRIDEIIIFHPLRKEELEKIVELQIDMVKKRLEKQDIFIDVSRKAKDLIAKEGYEPSFGARPLKRVIQNQILDKLAMEIIDGKIKPGKVIKIDAVNDKIVFEE